MGGAQDDDEADEHLVREAEKIAVALGRMFPGLCEVVLHDLRDPQHAIRVIENNLSGREVGDSATELGLARIADPDYPGVLQNYPNRFPDGRPVKSTSIGIKNGAGRYVAALCLNLDVSVLSPVTLALSQLVATDADHPTQPPETLRDRNARELRRAVEALSVERAATPARWAAPTSARWCAGCTTTAGSTSGRRRRPSPTCSGCPGRPSTTTPSDPEQEDTPWPPYRP